MSERRYKEAVVMWGGLSMYGIVRGVQDAIEYDSEEHS